MRKARIVAEKGAPGIYHITSRIVDKDRKFGPREKANFRKRLRDYEQFCGVQVLTYSIMSNHFHMELYVPPPPDQMPDDAELVRLAALADVSYGAKRLERELAEHRKNGDREAVEQLRQKFLRRMWNVSAYLQSVKQRVTQDFNKFHGREGTLWEGRFRSMLMEDTERAVAPVAAYVDLNPVRAGMVEDPGDYEWSGYGEAMRGGERAMEGLKRIVMECLDSPKLGETPAEEMERVLARYRVYLFEKGEGRQPLPDGTEGRLGIDPERVEEVLRTGGKLSVHEAVRCRNRYFTEGVVLGTEEFVEGVFERCRDHFGVRRRKGARELVGVNLPGMAVIGTLRKQAITCSRKE
jgi:putative transposase